MPCEASDPDVDHVSRHLDYCRIYAAHSGIHGRMTLRSAASQRVASRDGGSSAAGSGLHDGRSGVQMPTDRPAGDPAPRPTADQPHRGDQSGGQRRATSYLIVHVAASPVVLHRTWPTTGRLPRRQDEVPAGRHRSSHRACTAAQHRGRRPRSACAPGSLGLARIGSPARMMSCGLWQRFWRSGRGAYPQCSMVWARVSENAYAPPFSTGKHDDPSGLSLSHQARPGLGRRRCWSVTSGGCAQGGCGGKGADCAAGDRGGVRSLRRRREPVRRDSASTGCEHPPPS